ncbi:hypothetical protein ACLD0W_13930 [Alloalcanivorax sp. C16-1]|uniref:hypothetical protein n=1 Tax=Alloalcanivorax sp. C16-1 TaxID=3390051 RepID=UPI003970D210
MKAITSAAALAVAIQLSGCASIVSDSSYSVSLQSSPERANYVVTNQRSGKRIAAGVTPAMISLPAKNGFFSGAKYQVTFEHEGFNSSTVPLNASMDGWYWGNIVFGGLLGILIVDPATGAMWKLDDQVLVGLEEAPLVEPPLAPVAPVTPATETPASEEENAAAPAGDQVSTNTMTAPAVAH